MKKTRDAAIWFSLQAYTLLRVFLSLVAALVRWVYPGDLSPDPVFRSYMGVAPVEDGWQRLVLGVWQRWDTIWYMLISREGYSMRDTRIFAPPLYPWLMRLVGNLLGGTNAAHLLGGLIVSNLACIVLFIYLYRLIEMEFDDQLARRSIAYLAVFPSAFFLIAAYAESLSLLCIVAAFYYARRKKWVWAGVWGGLAPLARLPASIVILPLVYEFLRQWWSARRTERMAWWKGWPLILTALGALAFPLYAYFVVGSDSLLAPFTIHQQRFMGRFAMPWQSVWMAIRVLVTGPFRFIEPFDLLFAILFIGLTIAAYFKLPAMYTVYMAITLLGSLTKVSQVQPLLSFSRYVLVLFPGFILLAKIGQRSPWWNRLIVYTFVPLLIFFTGQFAIWGWVG